MLLHNQTSNAKLITSEKSAVSTSRPGLTISDGKWRLPKKNKTDKKNINKSN